LEQISEALREPMPTVTLPLASVPDEVENFGMMITSQLREFSEARRRYLMLKIHQLLYDEYSKNGQ